MSQGELDELEKESSAKGKKWISLYARDAQRLPYRLVYIGGVPGPHLPVPAGAEPGIIYCAISRDQKRYWVTGTGLDEPVAGEIVLARSFDHPGPLVVEERFDPSPDPVNK